MPEIEIRPAKQEDLENLIVLNHNYVSQYVLQMDMIQETNLFSVNFRKVRLPRPMNVSYPKTGNDLLISWQKATAIFVGFIGNEIISYVTLEETNTGGVVKIRDLVVKLDKRRLGIASGILLASEEWAVRRNNQTVMIELQTKNDPAVHMASKLGYQFCGYQDQYFPNKDMALFYSKFLH